MLDQGSHIRTVATDSGGPVYMAFSHTGYPSGKFAQSRLLAEMNISRILLNTVENDWYQRGIPGVGATIEETIGGLAAVLSKFADRDVVCSGASMGAYAALLFGCRIGAKRVISVAPEINIGEAWQRSSSMNRAGVFAPGYTALYDTIASASGASVSCASAASAASASGVEIYVAAYDLIDLASMDERLLDCAGVVTRFMSGDHKLAERIDWTALYSGRAAIGVQDVPGRPVRLHEYTGIKRALQEERRDAALKALLARCDGSNFAPDFFFAGIECVHAKDLQVALGLFRTACALDPSSVESRHFCGLCLKSRRAYDEAAAEFRAALALNNAAHPSHFQLAETLMLQGSREAAAPHMARALELDPKNVAYRAAAGRLHA